jgi:hypothetical protein
VLIASVEFVAGCSGAAEVDGTGFSALAQATKAKVRARAAAAHVKEAFIDREVGVTA